MKAKIIKNECKKEKKMIEVNVNDKKWMWKQIKSEK